ncbi:amidohydrolase [Nocardioides oleivorans]|uniref:Amidohydrolase n=1 Tax=Nocardioides oleivorans TaxID=273676 RepID=A0A4Q2RYX5_9ACTN|nr:amidohydrolase [Nocardioides oleivorans]RYB93169.1 amidohydrolase [Nocardioides oleivorans]
MPDLPATSVIAEVVDKHADDLVALRRDLHAHPELSWTESRTSDVVEAALDGTGWRITRPEGGGVLADIGTDGPLVALRADLDALPVDDLTADPWKSTVTGVAHACGHDVHTAGLVGAGLALAEVAARGLLPGRVRLLFQPAEEVMPGGALHLISTGALDDVSHVFGLHCDPSLDVGRIGLREGPLTGAADALTIKLSGKGGHTSRPHLTEDLTFALGKVITELPAILSRRLDPRAGVSVVWGVVKAGSAHNVIPHSGVVAGTVRMLDAVAWGEAEHLIRQLIATIVAPYSITAEVNYQRGVPPVVNHPVSTGLLGVALDRVLGPHGHVSTAQSLGGEDFGWYLDSIPGAMARLGTRTPGGPTYDLHQGNLRVDEAATPIASRVLAEAAVTALSA